MEQLALWSEEAPASHSASLESGKDSLELAALCGSTYVAFKMSCLNGSSGKTSQGRLVLNEGGAFKQLLESLDGLGYGLAWRILDAQFMRVPVRDGDGRITRWVGPVAQRRRRVFLVGHLGDMRAAEVLFEPESLCWDTPSSKQKREALTADARGRAAGSGGSVTAFVQNQRDEVRYMGGDGQIAGALSAARYSTLKQETLVAECLPPWDVQSKRVFPESACGPMLQAGTHEGQNIQPIVMASAHYNAEIGEGGVSPTLIAHIAKDAPVLATAMTCSQHSALPMAASSSSTTSQSAEGDSCSTRDGSGPDPICMADDTQNAAVDENLAGSLKVGGGAPFVALPLTERT